MPNEDSLRHKYTPLPEEPRHKKKARKVHVRSDHKHLYEQVCIDAHTTERTRDGEFPAYHIGTRCKVCGRLQNVKMWGTRETPDGMPLYEVKDFFVLTSLKVLSEEQKVRG